MTGRSLKKIPTYLAIAAALSAASVARADLEQVVYHLPALDEAGAAVPGCELKFTMQFDPEHRPAEGFKSIMFVHGGHWMTGAPLTKDAVFERNLITTQLTRRGFVVYSPEYRLIKAEHVKPKASQAACGYVSRADQHRDIQQAFEAAVLLTHYQDHAIVDTNYGVVLAGHSAGGHLVSYAAMHLPEELRGWVRGVIPVLGPVSFEHYWRAEHGLEPSVLEARQVALGDYSVELAPVSPKQHAGVLRSLGVYVGDGLPGQPAFVELAGDDPVLYDNSFARLYDPADEGRPPFYFVAGANDDLVPADGIIQSCEAIGPIADVRRISRGIWFWAQRHYIGRCGDGEDRLHLVTPADHGMNLNPGFWKDALAWADELDFQLPD